MLNNSAFDIVIGLVFIYLLYSLLGSLLQEIIATNIGLRGYVLKKAIQRMLDDNGSTSMCEQFYQHPLIKYLGADTLLLSKLPSYMDKVSFSKVVIDLLRGDDFAMKTKEELKAKIHQSLEEGKTSWGGIVIQNETLKQIQSLWNEAEADVDKFKELLEQWFEQMMMRSTGWYKRYTQLILFGIGIGISVAFNVDTLKIAKNLQENPELRQQIVNRADAFVKNHPNLKVELETNKKNIDSLTSITAVSKDSLKEVAETRYVALQALSDSLTKQASELVMNDIQSSQEILAIGWKGGFCKNFTLASLLGWLISALAISMGAPFWFDLLNKVMKLRSAVATGEKESKK